jgi:hypothetical protein
VTNPFYSSDETERSRAVLGEVVAALPDVILIGGWGTWVRTKGPMSHDIDLIVSHHDLGRLQGLAEDVSASHHIGGTKWRGTWRSIHLDLYVPYQSRLGANLQLRAETLQALSETVDGYRVLTVPAHLATKIAALLDRPDSLPGRKDRHEILALLNDPASGETPSVIGLCSARSATDIQALVKQAFAFLIEAQELNQRDRSRLRQVEVSWQQALAAAIERGLVRENGPGRDRAPGLGL